MNRSFAVLLVCLAVFGAAFGAQYRFGYVHADLEEVAPQHEVKAVAPAPGAPLARDLTRVDLTAQMPPVGDQQSQGSCMSWAVGYYHRTQLEYRERGWDLTDPRHRFSAAFIYNQVNGGADRGSGFDNNMPLVCEQGVSSEALTPYNQSDCVSWPSEAAYYEATAFRTRDWGWMRTRNEAELGNLKQLLANGSTVVIAILCWDNFMNISRYDNIYCVADKAGSDPGGHGVCIVGYDDSLPTRDGPGAFRIANSWGTGWGDRGYFWMSYAAVMDTDLSQRTVGWLTDTVGYQPTLFARVRFDHPTRDRVGLMFTVGRASSPLWYKEFRTWRHPGVDQPFPQNNIVFDLTEAAGHIAGRATDSVYLTCWDTRADGRAGTVEHLAGNYAPWYNWYPSAVTPVAIPDNGGLAMTGARVEQHDHDACAAAITLPTGIVEPGQQYQPVARVRNYGTAPASFPVTLRDDRGWSDAVTTTAIAPGDSADVTFGNWTAPAAGPVAFRCSTGYANDTYRPNDTVSARVVTRYHDVELVEILAPAGTVDSGASVAPKVRCRNNGTQAETFILRFIIPEEGYNRIAQLSIPAGQEGQTIFPNFTARNLGTHTMSCTLALAGDQAPQNNRINGQFEVTYAGIQEAPAAPRSARLRASPNPVRDRVSLTSALITAGSRLSIYDATGRCLITRPLDRDAAGVLELDTRPLPAGAYFVRLESAGRATTAVLVKQ
jgi:hypothetical protein